MTTNGFDTEDFRVTDLERTLIDITVRPIYSGGVKKVLLAYKNASNRLSLSKLFDYLKNLDFIYPYHQAIGFYLEKSGIRINKILENITEKEFKYNFYLDYNMKNPKYSKTWKLYYPVDL